MPERTNSLLGNIVLSKQTGTVLTLATWQTYVEDDVSFTIAAPTGAGAVTMASTDANLILDTDTNNIAAIFGTKTGSVPSSGYYIKINASGSSSSSITTAGWLEEGSLGTASATSSLYYPVQEATASISGTNTVTPSASVSGSNVLLSNVNNGVSITATGGGSASASVTATSVQAGYVPATTPIATSTVAASSSTTTASTYISGVVLNAPVSGTNNFSVTLPNGDGETITLTFKVDSTGSWVIE